MTRLLLVVVLFVSAVLLVSGCRRQGGATSEAVPNGVAAATASEERDVTGFTRIVLTLPGELEIIQNGTENIQIEAGAELLSKIRTRVQNGTLTIDTDATSFSADEPLRFTVYMYELTGLHVAGMGRVTAENLELETLELAMDGVGSATLSGQAQEVVMSVNGAGEVLARELMSERVSLTLNGASEVEVCALERLSTELNGVGEVRYYGNPAETDVAVDGVGSVERAGGCG